MKTIRRFKTPLLFLASFALPFVIIVTALIGLHITPFGDKTLVISDANGLYINYLGFVGRLFRGIEDFTYSFEKGLGGNMMPHINGTLLNPTFLLSAFYDVQDYPMMFTWISVLNFSLCGLTMYILLADLYGHVRSNLVFSTTYALSGFMVANVFQIIFFTGPQALPLMVLGLKKIFEGKNPLLYILSLSYALGTNAYFGFTVCVASVLLFFVVLWRDNAALQGRRLSIFVQYSISSLCGGLLVIFVWLPSFMGLMGGRLDKTSIMDFSFIERMPLIDILAKLFTGANSKTQLQAGLPNIFVGLLPIALVILYFINRKINRRRKIAVGLLLAIYFLCFYIMAFDMLMHAGTTPNWFNHRYSYVFSFLLLLIAAHEWQYVDDIPYEDMKKCFAIMLLASFLIFSKSYEFVIGSEMLLDFVLLLLIYVGYRMYRMEPISNPKYSFEAMTMLVVSISMCLNYAICTYNIMDWGIKESEYKKTVEAVAPLVKGLEEADRSFYRMEINHQRSESLGNDPMLYGYYGVGHGGSNERNFVRQELFKLGIQWYDMRNYYTQGIPAATDALLGLKYIVADENLAQEKGYEQITDVKALGLEEYGAVYDVYQSDYALPIAFLANNAVQSLELSFEDVFDNLNSVWSTVAASDSTVFVEEQDIQFKALHLIEEQEMSAEQAREIVRENDNKSLNSESASSDNSSGEDALIVRNIMKEVPQFVSSIEFSWVAKKDGPVYVYHRAALSTESGSSEPVLRYMGYYHAGDIVKGYMPVNSEYVTTVAFEEYSGRFRAAYADLDALETLSDMVRQSPAEIQRVRDNHLTGRFTGSEGQKLMFTIPWDAGWTCWVDGREVEIEKVLGVFMAVDATIGEHTFEMKYVPAGLSIGTKISIGTFIFTLLYLFLIRKHLKRLLIRSNFESPANQDIIQPKKRKNYLDLKGI